MKYPIHQCACVEKRFHAEHDAVLWRNALCGDFETCDASQDESIAVSSETAGVGDCAYDRCASETTCVDGACGDCADFDASSFGLEDFHVHGVLAPCDELLVAAVPDDLEQYAGDARLSLLVIDVVVLFGKA